MAQEMDIRLLDGIARVTDMANDAWNIHLKDTGPHVPWDARGTWDKDTVRRRALKIIEMLGQGAEDKEIAEEIHTMWVLRMLDAGWALGAEKDALAKTHPCLRPLPQLPEAQRRKCYLAIGVVYGLTRTDV